jgi:hypothetical protein
MTGANTMAQKKSKATPSLLPMAAALLLSAPPAQAAGFTNVDVVFKGAGWLKSGMIMESTDTLTGNGGNNYKHNWMQDAGVLFTGVVSLNENFEAAFGLGAIQRHPLQGKLNQAKDVRLGMNVFSTQSRISWFPQGKKDYDHRFDFGLFPYKYDNNIRNLGLYLIRGAVYPGLLVSGFEAKEMLNTANMLGARMENRFGSYTQDIVLTSETDLKPYFDFSAIYVGTWKPNPLFELGAGVNFYHYLPVRPGATSPSEEEGFDPASRNPSSQPHPFDYVYAVPTDSTVIQRPGLPDSVSYTYAWASHKGIKLMGRFVFDTRSLFPEESVLGKNDLKLYGEVGVIGVQDYPGIYNKISERIPVMLGLYLPTFKLLDVLALEMEYYGSKLVPDYRKVDQGSAVPQSPWINRTPPAPGEPAASSLNEPYDADGDNLKWSLYFTKVLAGHIRISGQVANDHFRTGGTPGLSGRSFEEGLTAPKDWYWFLKLSYFF